VIKLRLRLTYIVLILFSHLINAQYWIAGDTSELSHYIINQHFNPGDKVLFDIDCDGLQDFYLHATPPIDRVSPWSRLTLWMEKNVEVLNSDEGEITTFNVQDTISFENDVWTEHLSFIYGTGELGSYGHQLINNKFIAFRKNTEDTSYCFLRFSSSGINFSVHEIFSACLSNNILHFQDFSESTMIFPNPFESSLIIRGPNIKTVNFFDIGGVEVFPETINMENDVTNFNNLPSGIYIAAITFNDNTRKHYKIVKK
jgi:hypothetical protein